jgi:hypothetical protein
MSVTTWATLILTVLSILGFAITSIRFLVKHYFAEMKAELKPNGGGSIKDQVTRLETRANEADQLRREMDKKLDNMFKVLLDYIASKK